MHNITPDNTLFIFGCGESNYNELLPYIAHIQANWKTLGMNMFNCFHYGCTYWNWNDLYVWSRFLQDKYLEIEDIKKPRLVTTDEVNKKEVLTSSIKPYYTYDIIRESLYNFKKHINIYKTNHNDLDLEYIDIKEII